MCEQHCWMGEEKKQKKKEMVQGRKIENTFAEQKEEPHQEKTKISWWGGGKKKKKGMVLVKGFPPSKIGATPHFTLPTPKADFRQKIVVPTDGGFMLCSAHSVLFKMISLGAGKKKGEGDRGKKRHRRNGKDRRGAGQ